MRAVAWLLCANLLCATIARVAARDIKLSASYLQPTQTVSSTYQVNGNWSANAPCLLTWRVQNYGTTQSQSIPFEGPDGTAYVFVEFFGSNPSWPGDDTTVVPNCLFVLRQSDGTSMWSKTVHNEYNPSLRVKTRPSPLPPAFAPFAANAPARLTPMLAVFSRVRIPASSSIYTQQITMVDLLTGHELWSRTVSALYTPSDVLIGYDRDAPLPGGLTTLPPSPSTTAVPNATVVPTIPPTVSPADFDGALLLMVSWFIPSTWATNAQTGIAAFRLRSGLALWNYTTGSSGVPCRLDVNSHFSAYCNEHWFIASSMSQTGPVARVSGCRPNTGQRTVLDPCTQIAITLCNGTSGGTWIAVASNADGSEAWSRPLPAADYLGTVLLFLNDTSASTDASWRVNETHAASASPSLCDRSYGRAKAILFLHTQFHGVMMLECWEAATGRTLSSTPAAAPSLNMPTVTYFAQAGPLTLVGVDPSDAAVAGTPAPAYVPNRVMVLTWSWGQYCIVDPQGDTFLGRCSTLSITINALSTVRINGACSGATEGSTYCAPNTNVSNVGDLVATATLAPRWAMVTTGATHYSVYEFDNASLPAATNNDGGGSSSSGDGASTAAASPQYGVTLNLIAVLSPCEKATTWGAVPSVLLCYGATTISTATAAYAISVEEITSGLAEHAVAIGVPIVVVLVSLCCVLSYRNRAWKAEIDYDDGDEVLDSWNTTRRALSKYRLVDDAKRNCRSTAVVVAWGHLLTVGLVIWYAFVEVEYEPLYYQPPTISGLRIVVDPVSVALPRWNVSNPCPPVTFHVAYTNVGGAPSTFTWYFSDGGVDGTNSTVITHYFELANCTTETQWGATVVADDGYAQINTSAPVSTYTLMPNATELSALETAGWELVNCSQAVGGDVAIMVQATFMTADVYSGGTTGTTTTTTTTVSSMPNTTTTTTQPSAPAISAFQQALGAIPQPGVAFSYAFAATPYGWGRARPNADGSAPMSFCTAVHARTQSAPALTYWNTTQNPCQIGSLAGGACSVTRVSAWFWASPVGLTDVLHSANASWTAFDGNVNATWSTAVPATVGKGRCTATIDTQVTTTCESIVTSRQYNGGSRGFELSQKATFQSTRGMLLTISRDARLGTVARKVVNIGGAALSTRWTLSSQGSNIADGVDASLLAPTMLACSSYQAFGRTFVVPCYLMLGSIPVAYRYAVGLSTSATSTASLTYQYGGVHAHVFSYTAGSRYGVNGTQIVEAVDSATSSSHVATQASTVATCNWNLRFEPAATLSLELLDADLAASASVHPSMTVSDVNQYPASWVSGSSSAGDTSSVTATVSVVANGPSGGPTASATPISQLLLTNTSDASPTMCYQGYTCTRNGCSSAGIMHGMPYEQCQYLCE